MGLSAPTRDRRRPTSVPLPSDVPMAGLDRLAPGRQSRSMTEYQTHYGLRCRPFAETVEPAYFVPLPSREAALRRLRYGLEQARGPVLVYGPPGVGKTLLACRLTDSQASRSVHLTFPSMPVADLMSFLAAELSATGATAPGLAGTIRSIRTCLAEASSSGKRLVLMVDEAHLIDDPATFESLRLLLNFSSRGEPDLDLVLIGTPELLLKLPVTLEDRVATRVLVAPLDEAETAAYVAGRLQAAGLQDGQTLFTTDALFALHRASDGLPRRLNRLADLALLIAYARDQAAPDLDAVATAARELGVVEVAA